MFRLTDYSARITMRGATHLSGGDWTYHEHGYSRNDATAASLRYGEIIEVLLRRPGVVIGVELGCLFVEFRGFYEVTALESGARIEIVGLIEFWIEADRGFEFLLRVIEVLFECEGQTAGGMSFG